jgi:hypothetical protein
VKTINNAGSGTFSWMLSAINYLTTVSQKLGIKVVNISTVRMLPVRAGGSGACAGRSQGGSSEAAPYATCLAAMM